MKNFDKKIKDRLFDSEMAVSDDMWLRIEKGLNKKRRKPIWMWYLLIPLVMTAGLVVYLNLGDAEPQSPNLLVENTTIISESETSNHQIAMESSSEIEDISLITRPSILNTKADLISSTESKNVNLSFQIASSENFENNSQKVLNNDHTAKVEKKQLTPLQKLTVSNIEGLESKIEIGKSISSVSKCPQFKSSRPNLYLYSNLGLNYPIQFLSSLNTEYQAQIDNRVKTESGLMAFSFDAGLGFEFNSGYFFEMGLMYDQINMSFRHVEESDIQTEIYYQIKTYVNGQGVEVSDTIDSYLVQTGGETVTSGRNVFKKIDIPMIVGYNYVLNDKFDIELSAGASINFRMTSYGKMIDHNEVIMAYGNNQNGDVQSMFKNRVGISYIGRLKLGHIINKRMKINAGLDMRYYPENFNNRINNFIDQNYMTFGISAGLKYML